MANGALVNGHLPAADRAAAASSEEASERPTKAAPTQAARDAVFVEPAADLVVVEPAADVAVVRPAATLSPVEPTGEAALTEPAPNAALAESAADPATLSAAVDQALAELAGAVPVADVAVARLGGDLALAPPSAGLALAPTITDGDAVVTLPRRDRRAGGIGLAQMGVRISVVMPARNEAENLPYVFAHLPDGLHEVIVVDGHSIDDTVDTARRLRPDVRIVAQTGGGKGNALAAGFAVCTGDIVVTLDADGSTDPVEIPRFVAALCNGADFVKGSRFAQGGGSSDITRVRRLGNRMLSVIVNNVYGTSYTDLCYGYNAFWTRCLPYMRVDCNGFEVETLINVRIAKAGLIVHEVPSYEQDRIYGASNLHAIRDGIRVLSTIGVERISAARPRSRLPLIARRLMT